MQVKRSLHNFVIVGDIPGVTGPGRNRAKATRGRIPSWGSVVWSKEKPFWDVLVLADKGRMNCNLHRSKYIRKRGRLNIENSL